MPSVSPSSAAVLRPAACAMPAASSLPYSSVLWSGTGKISGDMSTSGYDYAIAQALARHGTNADDIATTLARWPTGAQERARKGKEYLSRTVTNAITRKGR
jgi:hypothetical protein